ncbi:hypothetical protein AB4Y96_12920 [Phyllobacterium sp. TAF24]|jgi:hypothetical protein|uniref:hypothetical protein n=1 Tax=unclassified Phyllobacterium TaxID=2638441 RepID=UPI00088BACE9|nr:hypothetical protein [Phyllobacterium sp. OV277]SDP70215.1 hypothetical protein SAMN05443582_10892 [Phyllobacterium sp. OV277]
MKKFALVLSLLTLSTCFATLDGFAASSSVPCEDMLKEVRAAKTAATLTDAEKTKVAELEAKGVERCTADDDKRADEFFAQALKLMGK